MIPWGIEQSDWDKAKAEAREAMIACAKARRTMAYSDLTSKITSVGFSPDEQRFHRLLDEISEDEHGAGHGLLSAVVILKSGDGPGTRFFKLAEKLGRDTQQPLETWIRELEHVHSQWATS